MHDYDDEEGLRGKEVFAHQAIELIGLVGAQFQHRDPYLVRELNKLKAAIEEMEEAVITLPSGAGGDGSSSSDGGDFDGDFDGDYDGDYDSEDGEDGSNNTGNSMKGGATVGEEDKTMSTLTSQSSKRTGEHSSHSSHNKHSKRSKQSKHRHRLHAQQRWRKRRMEAMEVPLEVEMSQTSSWHDPQALPR
jgi:hypothetical protein